MLAQFHYIRFYLVLIADIGVFVIAFVGAYLLRFDFTLEPFFRVKILKLLPFILLGKIFIFFIFGLYRGMWRFTGLHDLYRLVQDSVLSMLFYIAAALYIHGFQPIPRSVFFLDAMLTFIMSGGLRMAIRPYMSAY